MDIGADPIMRGLRRKAKILIENEHVECSHFDLPPLTFRAGDLSLTHKLTVLYSAVWVPVYGGKTILAFVQDELVIQQGMKRSDLTTFTVLWIDRTGAKLNNLWGSPVLSPRLQELSNPPEFETSLKLGGQAHIIPGRGTAGPLAVSATELSAKPEVTERETLTGPQAKEGFVVPYVPRFVMKKAKPATEYRVDFTCQLGSALGTVSNKVNVKTAQIINKPK